MRHAATSPWPSLFLLACLYTGLNALKPLQVDDAAYYYYAAQIAEHPADPYGHEVFWYQYPLPANHVLAPPLVPYWWAAGIYLFGDHIVLWKLWLLPFAVVLVAALYALFRRFARGQELRLVWLTVLSPVLLPSLNLMLDVPALALSLLAVATFLRGYDRGSLAVAAAAGLLAGLAMQAKYTAFLAPAVMLLYAAVQVALGPEPWGRSLRRALLVLPTVGVAAGVFVGWEAFIAQRYGESHFLHEYRSPDRDLWQQFAFWAMPLLALLGGATPVVGLLGLAASCRRRWPVWLAAGAVALGYGTVACFMGTVTANVIPGAAVFGPAEEWSLPCSLEQVVYTALGAGVALAVARVAWRLLRVGRGGLWRPTRWRRNRAEWFLVLWLAGEVAGYFAMTPFGAARRVLGIAVVATLLAGRLAARTGRRPGGAAVVRGLAAGSAALGLIFFLVDYRDAVARRDAAETAAAWVRQRDPGATAWYVGHWSFQFYAERAGLRPVVPDDPDRPLRRGDWLVVPDRRLEQQLIRLNPDALRPAVEFAFSDRLPLRTVQCFYGTATGVPLEHQEGPRIRVTVYRVRRTFVPRTP